jgi:hypothetical protein
MSTTVKWAVVSSGDTGSPSAELMVLAPVPLLKYLLNARSEVVYLRCYSVLEACKNSFVVLSPYDLTITVNPETNFITVKEFTNPAYNSRCKNRGATDRGLMMTMPPALVFYSKEDVVAEVMPTQLIDLPKNTALISGRYNISKWIRPVDWTFELVNGATEVQVKRGDPLFVIRFTPKNDNVVVLEQVPFTTELYKATSACTEVKDFMPRTPLNKLYDMAASYMSKFHRK